MKYMAYIMAKIWAHMPNLQEWEAKHFVLKYKNLTELRFKNYFQVFLGQLLGNNFVQTIETKDYYSGEDSTFIEE